MPALTIEQLTNYGFYTTLPNESYPSAFMLEHQDKEKAKTYLNHIEQYLSQNNVRDLLEQELQKISYYIEQQDLSKIYYIKLDQHPLIKLFYIRQILIYALSSTSSSTHSGLSLMISSLDWRELYLDNKIKLNIFFESRETQSSQAEANALNIQNVEAAVRKTFKKSKNSVSPCYLAFCISNGTYSEPYILKIINEKITEVIRSQSGHSTSPVHSDLLRFILTNNPECKYHSTLPLQHDGDCTRYSHYALLQFKHLEDTKGGDQAFQLLTKKDYYLCNSDILRDFQMLHTGGYNLINESLYPIPESISLQSSTPSKKALSPAIESINPLTNVGALRPPLLSAPILSSTAIESPSSGSSIKEINDPLAAFSNFRLKCLFFAGVVGAFVLLLIGLTIVSLPLWLPVATTAPIAFFGVGGGIALLGGGALTGLAGMALKSGFFSNSSNSSDSKQGYKHSVSPVN